MMMFLISILLIGVFCSHVTDADEQVLIELLKLARRYRDGSDGIAKDPLKSQFYYNDLIKKIYDETWMSSSSHIGSMINDAISEFVDVTEKNFAKSKNYIDLIDVLKQAANEGHADSQFKLGTIYGTGIYISGLMPMDAGRSLLLEYLAAIAGHAEANMAMGYRYLNGIGVPESCDQAKKHYEFAANVAVKQIEDRGYPIYIDKTKLSDVDSIKAKYKRNIDVNEEILDYYKHLAEEGDTTAALTLGIMFLSGTRFLPQDYENGKRYLMIAAKHNSPQSAGLLGYTLIQELIIKTRRSPSGKPASITGELVSKHDESVDDLSNFTLSWSSEIVHSLGLQQQKGFNSPIDYIINLLEIAARAKDSNGIAGLGLASFRGIGVKTNITKAIEYFQSIQVKHSDAGFYLGELYMGQGLPTHSMDVMSAMQVYTTSSQKGNTLSQHRLGHMHATGIGYPKNCPAAVEAFKSVAERGDWMSEVTQAQRLYLKQDYPSALLYFSRFAAIGVEIAQFNAAHILMKNFCPPWTTPKLSNNFSINSSFIENSSQDLTRSDVVAVELSRSVVELDQEAWQLGSVTATGQLQAASSMARNAQLDKDSDNNLPKTDCEIRALQFLGLSGGQHDAESWLLIGDIHYYGKAGLTVDKTEAARFYQMAADLRHPHANFNLGIMHESGDGIVQDYHLAKRYFDQAANYDSEADIPRQIAVVMLQQHEFLMSNLDKIPGIDPTRSLELLTTVYNAFINANRIVKEIIQYLNKLRLSVQQPFPENQNNVVTDRSSFGLANGLVRQILTFVSNCFVALNYFDEDPDIIMEDIVEPELGLSLTRMGVWTYRFLSHTVRSVVEPASVVARLLLIRAIDSSCTAMETVASQLQDLVGGNPIGKERLCVWSGEEAVSRLGMLLESILRSENSLMVWLVIVLAWTVEMYRDRLRQRAQVLRQRPLRL